MKPTRMVLALALLGVLAGVAYVGQLGQPAGSKMAASADAFLKGLTPEQKTKATFPFDSKERTRWFFTPQQNAQKQATRKGLPLEEMNAEQKKAALALVAAGTSSIGNQQALTIMSLESILKEQEKKGAMVRNPEWYFFTLFGTPGSGKWGWRVEGHHLSLNFTIDGDKVIASTPTFFGANPAEIKSGPKKGFRTLASAEDLAIQLFGALDDSQKKVAFQDKDLPEIKEATVESPFKSLTGLVSSKMSEPQRDILNKLLHAYTERMPADVAKVERDAAKGDFDKIHFAYTGGTKAGEPHTYRVHGPSFVIEFLNVQKDSGGNPANHIHSVWRRVKGDFGIN